MLYIFLLIPKKKHQNLFMKKTPKKSIESVFRHKSNYPERNVSLFVLPSLIESYRLKKKQEANCAHLLNMTYLAYK